MTLSCWEMMMMTSSWLYSREIERPLLSTWGSNHSIAQKYDSSNSYRPQSQFDIPQPATIVITARATPRYAPSITLFEPQYDVAFPSQISKTLQVTLACPITASPYHIAHTDTGGPRKHQLAKHNIYSSTYPLHPPPSYPPYRHSLSYWRAPWHEHEP